MIRTTFRSARLLFAGLTALVLGCGPSSNGTAPAADVTESAPELAPAAEPSSASLVSDHDHDWIVDWATLDTFGALLASSDVALRGRVVGRRPAVLRSYGWNAEEGRPRTPEEAGGVYGESPLTVSTIQVDEVITAGSAARALDGAPVLAGKKVEVAELGGTLRDGCTSVPRDKPLLAEGEEVVVLLSGAGRTGAYHVVGGWQGRFTVREGVLHALASDVHPDFEEVTRFTGKPVAELVAFVKRFAPVR